MKIFFVFLLLPSGVTTVDQSASISFYPLYGLLSHQPSTTTKLPLFCLPGSSMFNILFLMYIYIYIYEYMKEKLCLSKSSIKGITPGNGTMNK